jgi:hypothetical protein
MSAFLPLANVAERLAQVQALSLKAGSHDDLQHGMCVMEAVAYVAGEPWSYEPQCACPVITAFMVAWNDGLPSDAKRDRLLKPLVPLIVGTRSTPAVEQRRAVMAADWLIRVYTPAWLQAAKLKTQAAALQALPEITDFAQCQSLVPTLNAVKDDAAAARDAALPAARDAAWDEAWDAARDAAWAAAGAGAAAGAAAWDAARDAAGAAAGAAAWDAARDAALAAAGAAAKAAAGAAAKDAAWNAPWAAAGAAAKAAAGAAAGAAARVAFQPVTGRLQDSAVNLVRRMILEAA